MSLQSLSPSSTLVYPTQRKCLCSVSFFPPFSLSLFSSFPFVYAPLPFGNTRPVLGLSRSLAVSSSFPWNAQKDVSLNGAPATAMSSTFACSNSPSSSSTAYAPPVTFSKSAGLFIPTAHTSSCSQNCASIYLHTRATLASSADPLTDRMGWASASTHVR